ncbi:hypothetical protein Tco_1291445 [Tanacetum coccineum]
MIISKSYDDPSAEAISTKLILEVKFRCKKSEIMSIEASAPVGDYAGCAEMQIERYSQRMCFAVLRKHLQNLRTRCLLLITESTEDVQPPVVQIQSRNPNPEPNVAPVVTPVPKASIPFPSRRNDEKRKDF